MPEGSLHEQLRHLQEDWNSYKLSMPRHRRSLSTSDLTTTSPTPGHLLHHLLLPNSPKKLLSSLQNSNNGYNSRNAPSPPSGSGKLKGRRLLEALDDAASPAGNETEISSVASSVLSQGASSSCSCSAARWSCCSSCSSVSGGGESESSSLSRGDGEEEEEEVAAKGSGENTGVEEKVAVKSGGGNKEVLFLFRISIGLGILWGLSVCILREVYGWGGVDYCGDYMVPT